MYYNIIENLISSCRFQKTKGENRNEQKKQRKEKK